MGAGFDDDTPPMVKRRRRESGDAGWSRYERLVLAALERLEDKGDRLEEKVDHQALRLAALEVHRAQTVGVESVRSTVWKWVLGLVAAVLAGLIMLAVRGAMK